MAVTGFWYAQAFRSAFHKEMNLESDTLKISLHTSAYSYNLLTDRYFSDTAHEITGTGYTAGGKTLASVVVTDTGGTWSLACANPSWTSATFSAAIAVVYDSTPGSPSTNPLICVIDFGGTQSVSAGTFQVDPDPSGLISITP